LKEHKVALEHQLKRPGGESGDQVEKSQQPVSSLDNEPEPQPEGDHPVDQSLPSVLDQESSDNVQSQPPNGDVQPQGSVDEPQEISLDISHEEEQPAQQTSTHPNLAGSQTPVHQRPNPRPQFMTDGSEYSEPDMRHRPGSARESRGSCGLSCFGNGARETEEQRKAREKNELLEKALKAAMND
jgi:hypothetical protein